MSNVSLSSAVSNPPSDLRPVWMERQWVAIDTAGTVRNSLNTAATFLGSATQAAQRIAQMIPGFQLFGGALICYNAVKHNLPNVWKEYREVASEDTEGKINLGLSVGNQVLYLAIGQALAAAGATGVASLLTSGTAASALAETTQIVANGVLGGLCLVRGGVMIARTAYNLSYLLPFHQDFRSALTESKEKASQFLYEAMGKTDIDFARFKRRVGDAAAEQVQDYFKTNGQNAILDNTTLLAVDKGIFKQKCKQWLTLSIAILMIIGAIASLVFSAGLTGLVVAGIAGISFALMEADWLVFDKSSWFNALVDRLYQPPPSLIQQIPAP